jgi:2,3-bisphosphoglycerate-independent phosphoglycerate mutase
LRRRPLLLVVLDGFGHRVALEHNAVRKSARTFYELCARYPNALLSASGEEVGLPLGLMGNSEVGHMNLGAGRVVYQEITRIDKSIREGRFFEIGAFRALCERVRKDGKRLHLLGLVSDGGVHSSDHHLRSLIELARRAGLARDAVVVHAILDGRDTPPRSGAGYVEALEQDLSHAGVGRIGTVVGRYWAMDRDKRWERVQRAYNLLTAGVGTRHTSALEAVHASYAADKGDEFVEPRVIGDPAAATMQDQDGVLCFNFRADRMREIVSALGLADFTGFERKLRPALEIVTMTQYRADLPFAVAYPPVELRGTFGEVLAAHRLRQERIAETEKYAHVTFFFSGGREAEVQGESRTLVPSPKVATYDLKPEMSAFEVKDVILRSLARGETDAYVINFANADMVGHTGIEPAAEAAVRAIDACLAKIVPAAVDRGGLVAITADHGNAELMWDEEHQQPHTAHTTNPVPFVLCARDLVGLKLRPMGILADVVPTLLELTDVEKPAAMDGVSMLA